MSIANLLARFKAKADPVRQQAIANAYLPVLRTILVPGCAYYAYITWSHWQDETGRILAVLSSVSALTAFSYYLLRQYVLSGNSASLS